MRHICSQEVGDLAEIYADDVEMVSVSRPRAERLEQLANDLFQARNAVELRWEQDVENPDAAARVLSNGFNGEFHQLLTEEVSYAGEVLGQLLECKKIGIRLATLHRPMCPKFHVDQVPCRLLATIGGERTEWIPHLEVDFDRFAERDIAVEPLRSGGSVRQTPAGGWSLLKGGKWQDPFRGVVHRSPQREGQRLLLSVDPVFV